MERRFLAMPVEVREIDGKPSIEGHAAVFDQYSDDLGGWQEIIRPGSFAGVLGDDVRCLWQHDELYVLGRRQSETLAIWEDEVGLRYRVTPPETQWARDALVTVRRGDVNQSSFRFIVMPDGERWFLDAQGSVKREINRFAALYDVGPVTFPAYPTTTAQARSKIDELRAQQASSIEQIAEQLEARARQAAERARVLQLHGG